MEDKQQVGAHEIFSAYLQMGGDFMGKTMKEWYAYFDIPVSGLYHKGYIDEHDIVSLRMKMAETSDKLDECLNYLSQLRFTCGVQLSDEEINMSNAINEYKKNGVKTTADAERRAKSDLSKLRASRKYLEGWIAAWEEMKWKLHYKQEVLNNLLISESTEMKYLRNSNYNA